MNNIKQGFSRFAENRNKSINIPDDKIIIGNSSYHPLGKKTSITTTSKPESRFFFDKTTSYKFANQKQYK